MTDNLGPNREMGGAAGETAKKQPRKAWSSASLGYVLVALAVIVAAGIIIALRTMPSEPTTTPQMPTAAKPLSIGVSFADLEGRWQTERDVMAAAAKQLGATITFASADMDVSLQNRQAQNLILQGVDALIVIPQDGEKAAAIVESAHRAGIKVIAYDRLIKNADVDYYLSFNNNKIGEVQAQGILDIVQHGDFAYIGGSLADNNAVLLRQGTFRVLQPKIDSGAVKLRLDKMIPNWAPKGAYQAVKDYLDGGGRLDAVIVANDGMASGVVQALQERGLAGRVAVSGQDAELGACRHVIAGTQSFTIYKPLKQLATAGFQAAVALASGQPADAPTVTNNGKIDVPSRLLDVILVNKTNMMDTVIKDGVYTQADVYGPAAPAKTN